MIYDGIVLLYPYWMNIKYDFEFLNKWNQAFGFFPVLPSFSRFYPVLPSFTQFFPFYPGKTGKKVQEVLPNQPWPWLY